MSETNIDPELNAIQVILKALEPLDTNARKRVSDYISKRLNLSFVSNQNKEIEKKDLLDLDTQTIVTSTPNSKILDIRSLKEQKKPSTANEMAAIVAFYLAEFAPDEDKKTSIETSDIEKYFKQASFPLPKVISQTLQNAMKSGFFDSTGGGRYRLNPVGYNLVVHGLPSKSKKSK